MITHRKAQILVFCLIILCVNWHIAVAQSQTDSPACLVQARKYRDNAYQHHYQDGNFESALNAYQQAEQAAQEAQLTCREPEKRQEASQIEGEALFGIGLLHLNPGQEYQQALSMFRNALGIFQHIGNQEDAGVMFQHIGIAQAKLQQYGSALESFNQALQIAREPTIRDRQTEMTVLYEKAHVLMNSGRFTHALKNYRQALDIAIADKASGRDKARIRVGVGNAQVELGQYKDAIHTYLNSLVILEQEQDFSSAGRTLNNLGTTFTRLGNYAEALKHFQQARATLPETDEIDDVHGMTNALLGIAGIYEEWGTQQFTEIGSITFFPKARLLYEDILTVPSLPDRDRMITLNNLGKLIDHWCWQQQDMAAHPQALTYYEDALRISTRIGALAVKARILNNLGEVYLHLSHYDDSEDVLHKAVQFLHDALALQREIGSESRSWQTRSLLAQVYQRQGKTDEAIQEYRQTIRLAETFIEAAGVEELKVGLGSQAAETYQRFIDLLAQRGQIREAFEYSERARAQAFREQLRKGHFDPLSKADETDREQYAALRTELAALEERVIEQKAPSEQNSRVELSSAIEAKRDELEQFYLRIKLQDPQYARMIAADTGEQNVLKDVQPLLTPDTTLIEYAITPQTILAFVITDHTFDCVDLHLMPEEVRKNIQITLQIPDSADMERSRAYKELYQALIAPLTPDLKTSTVGIIPHGMLHYLPFAALTDGTQDMIDMYTLFFLPGASVLPYIQPQKDEKTDREEKTLVLANSRAPGFETLRYSDHEAIAIARLNHVIPFIGGKATETLFKDQAGEHRRVHLSAHGELNVRNPLFSRIVLHADEENDGYLEVHEIYQLNLQDMDLVTLSACDTKLGRHSKGDEIIGLNRAFLYAGASSVVSSLWKVNDQATSTLMNIFYLSLSLGKGKAEALQAAQRVTRKNYPHPYYWAGFVLTGDPGGKASLR